MQELHEDAGERAAITVERVTCCSCSAITGAAKKNLVVTHHSSDLIVQTVQSCHSRSPECLVRVVPRAVRSLCC